MSWTPTTARVVGWQFAAHMRTDLVLDALRMALALTEPVDEVELVNHSDAGSQYTSFDYSQTLTTTTCSPRRQRRRRLRQRSRRELRDTFKTELIRDRVWRTRAQLELAIVECVAWYNTRRLHSALGDITPAGYTTLETAR